MTRYPLALGFALVSIPLFGAAYISGRMTDESGAPIPAAVV